jgi:hypothetical protein
MQVDFLEILEDAVCSSSSVEVGWQAPSKNAERITGFKLMVASSTGVVRDVYQVRARPACSLGASAFCHSTTQ